MNEQFATGAQRDSGTDKPRMDLIDIDFMLAVARHIGDVCDGGEHLYTTAEIMERVYLLDTSQINYIEIAAHIIMRDTQYDIQHAYERGARKLALLPYDMLRRIGLVLYYGGVQYGDNNWRKGMPLDRTHQSLMRHMWAWAAVQFFGYEDYEDHAAALFVNCMFQWYNLKIGMTNA